MDNKQIFHIAGEVIVVGCISLYFINQIKKLNEEISTLKDELKSQKEVTNRNFNQIYAILNSAFNIPVMPVRGESPEKLRKDQEVIGKEPKSQKTIEVKDPFLETDDEEEEKYPSETPSKISKEQFSHEITPMPRGFVETQMVRGPNISMVSMMTPLMTPIMSQMGQMQMDGMIINIDSATRFEENLGPRKRNVRNNEVEISDVTVSSDKGYLMTETKKDMEDDSDEEIEDELELLGIQQPSKPYTTLGGNPDVKQLVDEQEVRQETQQNKEIENSEESFTIETSIMEEEKPVKVTKRKKNLKNNS